MGRQEKYVQRASSLSAMDQGCFHIRRRRWPHHETPVGCLIEPHTTISVVHITDDLVWIQQNNEMLGQYCQGIHNKILLRQPDGASFRNAKPSAYYAHIHIRKFVWIAHLLHAARAGDFGHS